MLSKRSLLPAAVLTVLAITPAMAGPWSFALMGGMTSPTGDYGKDSKTGFNIGAGVDYGLTDMISVGVDGSWNTTEHKGVGQVESGVRLDEDKFNIIQVGAHAKFKAPMAGSQFKPYGIVGLGIFNLKEDYKYTVIATGATGTDETDEAAGYFKQPGTRFGGKVGAGALYKMNGMVGIGAEAAFNFISLEKGSAPGGGSKGSSAQYISIQAGVTFTPSSK